LFGVVIVLYLLIFLIHAFGIKVTINYTYNHMLFYTLSAFLCFYIPKFLRLLNKRLLKFAFINRVIHNLSLCIFHCIFLVCFFLCFRMHVTVMDKNVLILDNMNDYDYIIIINIIIVNTFYYLC